MKYIVITRPEEDFAETVDILGIDGYEPYSLPLSIITYLPISFPKYQNYIVTSKNAIRSIQKNGISLTGNIICLNNNYIDFPDANIIKAGNNAREILHFLTNNPDMLENCLYIRGNTITCDIKRHFQNKIDEIIAYKIHYKTELSDKEKSILSSDCIITLFSSKNAENLLKFIELSRISSATFIAFSHKIANILYTAGLKNVYFADNPSITSLKNKIYEVINGKA